MAQFPGLLLWTDAWVADTKHLSRLERGTYLDLLVLMWRTPGCRVPNDDEWLAKRLAMTPAEVAAELRPLIVEFCQTDGNWIFQKRLQKEFVRAFNHSEKQSDRAKSRWDKEKGLYRGNANTHGRGNARLALHPTQEKKDPFLYRAREDEEPEGAGDKKPAELSRQELETLFAAKRKHE